MRFQTWLYLVVVSQHPAQPYCVLVGNPVPEFSLGGQNAKLGLIISVLETVLVESHLERRARISNTVARASINRFDRELLYLIWWFVIVILFLRSVTSTLCTATVFKAI